MSFPTFTAQYRSLAEGYRQRPLIATTIATQQHAIARWKAKLVPAQCRSSPKGSC